MPSSLNVKIPPRLICPRGYTVDVVIPVINMHQADYATNEVPPSTGLGTFSVVPPEVQERAGRTAAEHLDWLGQAMLASGDPTGALLAALMVRHLVHDEDPRLLGFSPTALYGQLGGIAQQAFPDVTDASSLVAPFDAILAELNRRTQGGE